MQNTSRPHTAGAVPSSDAGGPGKDGFSGPVALSLIHISEPTRPY